MGRARFPKTMSQIRAGLAAGGQLPFADLVVLEPSVVANWEMAVGQK